MEKKMITELVFILDGSGSMSHLTDDTIGGFNSMIQEQNGKGTEKLVTTVIFNTTSHNLYTRLPIAEVPKLTNAEYHARGGTALCDAVGVTINDIMNRQIAEGPENRPESTLFFITTDGRENSSHNFSSEAVRGMIQNAQEQNGWEFIYIGASMDDVRTARNFGIRDEDIACFRETNGAAERCKFHAMSNRIRTTEARLVRENRLDLSPDESSAYLDVADITAWKDTLEKDFGFHDKPQNSSTGNDSSVSEDDEDDMLPF